MPRARSRTFRISALLTAGLAFAPIPAGAFGTINIAGQAAEHERITRLALGPMGFERYSLDEIAGKGGLGRRGRAGQPRAQSDHQRSGAL